MFTTLLAVSGLAFGGLMFGVLFLGAVLSWIVKTFIWDRAKIDSANKKAERIVEDAVKEGENILIIDDLLATGGTSKATVDLVEELKGKVAGIAFLIDLTFLGGIKKLEGYEVFSLIKY